VHMFAYGQTGSGKTHTMFGPRESLKSMTPQPDWGLMPRAVEATLKRMADLDAQGKTCILMASAVEFAAGNPYDLNAPGDEKPLCAVTVEAEVLGNEQTQLSSPEEFAPFLERCMAKRTTANNKMNTESSRSHVALILTLHQVCRSTQKYTQTFFSLVDLAGSERQAKTGGTEQFDLYAMWGKMMKGEPLSIAEQGFLINEDLMTIVREVIKATDINRQGKVKYSPPKQLLSQTGQFLLGPCDGKARLGMVVCLSQSPQNGFESYESLRYGADLAKLKVPVSKAKTVGISKQIEKTQKALANAESLTKGGAQRNFNTVALRLAAATNAGKIVFFQKQLELLGRLQSSSGPSCAKTHTRDSLVEAFQCFDEDHSGYVTRDNLIAILTRGSKAREANGRAAQEAAALADELLAKFDTNGDGQLDVEEFSWACAEQPHLCELCSECSQKGAAATSTGAAAL